MKKRKREEETDRQVKDDQERAMRTESGKRKSVQETIRLERTTKTVEGRKKAREKGSRTFHSSRFSFHVKKTLKSR